MSLLRCAAVVTPALLAVCLAAGCAPSATQLEARRAEVRHVLAEQAAAWNCGDLDGYMKAYWQSEELTFSSGGETTAGFDRVLEQYRRSFPTPEQMGRLTFDDLRVRLLGEQAALVLGRWRLERSEETLAGNFSLVLERRDGRWRIIHDHTSRAPES